MVSLLAPSHFFFQQNIEIEVVILFSKLLYFQVLCVYFCVLTFTGGVVFNRFQQYETGLMFISTLGMGAISLAPHFNSLVTVTTFFYMAGIAEGMVNVGKNFF